MEKIIVTTTNNIEGKTIIEYKDIIFGEVVSGVNLIKDFTAGLTNIFGGRSGSYEDELVLARENAINELKQRANNIGANAIVGVKVDYETLGQGGSMLMVTVSGTAVIVR